MAHAGTSASPREVIERVCHRILLRCADPYNITETNVPKWAFTGPKQAYGDCAGCFHSFDRLFIATQAQPLHDATEISVLVTQ
jgi:hypothetical protein